MKTFLRIQSEYFEIDSSKYRLFITENTLIPSLHHQINKNFTILLTMSAMDPCYSRRRKLFESVGVEVRLGEVDLASPRIEINVGDDDFLCGNFTNVIQRVPVQKQNTSLLSPKGYIFKDGKLQIWNNHPDIVEVHQIVEQDNHIRGEYLVSSYPGWIYVRHKQNLNPVPDSLLRGPEIANLKWPGWNQNVVTRVSQTNIVTASAKGCEVHPTRSKSVVFAKGSFRQRRKK